MAYEDFKGETRGTTSDKILHKNPKYREYKRGLTSMVYKFFDKKIADGAVNNEVMSNEESLELYLINSSNYTN